MKPLPFGELYVKLAPVANPEHRPSLPSGMQQEIGHFNVGHRRFLLIPD